MTTRVGAGNLPPPKYSEHLLEDGNDLGQQDGDNDGRRLADDGDRVDHGASPALKLMAFSM